MDANTAAETAFGVLTTDRELVVKVWDNVLARFTGVSPDDACGKRLQELFPEIEERGFVKYLHRVLTSGTVEVLAPAFHRYFIACPTESPSQRFDKMLQRTTIAPVREDNEVVGVIVTIEDVTARVERERELGELLSGSDDEARLRAIEEISQAEEVADQSPLIGALNDSNWRVRRSAIEGLAKRPAPDAIKALLNLLGQDYRNLEILNSALQVLTMVDVDTFSPLVGFLRHADPDLRMQAALALGEQRDLRAVDVLLDALNDEDANVRFHVIEALGKLHATAATNALMSVAETHDFFLGFPALEALKEIGDASVAARLIPLLKIESLREQAALTLAEIGDESAVAPLAELLNTPQAPVIAVASALARLHDRFEKDHRAGRFIAELGRQSIKASGAQQLLDALSDVSEGNLRSLALVIGWLRGPAVERTLIRLLSEPSARSEVIESLVKHGASVADLLIEHLNSSDLETRRASIIALGKLGQKRATLPLTKVMESAPSLKGEVASALARLGDEAAVDALVKLLGDTDGSVRQAAVGALNSIGSTRMPDLTRALLSDPEPLVRESAAKIAGYFGYVECADLLIERCRDDDERVRRAAVEHLPFLEDTRVVAELSRVISEDTPRVRAAAALAMASLDDRSSRESLIAALRDSDSWVRYFAAKSLGRRVSVESIPALSQLLGEEKLDHVRIAALQAIGQMSSREASEILESHLTDSNPDVARAAAAALKDQRAERV